MSRAVQLAPLFLILAACAGNDGARDLEYTVLVDDPRRPWNLALSPDANRMAWAMPVDGDAKIFVANADGSNLIQLTDGVWDYRPVWSPDGRWIAYAAESPDFDLFVVPSDGGESRQLTSGPGRDQPSAWLPDGSGIVFNRTGVGDVRTLVVPLGGGPARPLIAPVEGNQWVTLSPDGTKAAFDLHRGGEGTIWVQDLAGGAARQLTTEGLENALPTRNMWSPDGRSLAFVSRRTGTWDIWTADVETGALRQLTTDIRNDQQHSWSPDGRTIAFISDRGGQTDLWIVPASGGRAVRVTHDLAAENNPQWSADGATLYYEWSEEADQLHVTTLPDGSPRVLVALEGYQISSADISPDGRTVLFASNRSGNNDIWSIPFGGGEPAPFTASPLEDRRPRFSPDGRTVLFESNRGGSFDLWVTPVTGGEARRLTDWPSFEGGARWSPDGSRIAYVSDRDATQSEVWVMPAAGGAATRLTHNNVAAEGLGWSPDGQSVYFNGLRPDSTRALYRVPAKGGRVHTLEASPGIEEGALSPDGSQYAYLHVEGGLSFIEVVPTAGGPPRRITSQERAYQCCPRWSPDGSRLAFSTADYAGGFTADVLTVPWPDGGARPLTTTPHLLEFALQFTPDGRALLLLVESWNTRFMSVSVAALLPQETPERVSAR